MAVSSPMTHSIEQTLLSSLMEANNKTIASLNIKEEYFKDNFHKLIVKCILWLVSNNKEFDFEIVLYYISKNNQVNIEQWFQVIGMNPFATTGTINTYLDVLKESQKGRVDEI